MEYKEIEDIMHRFMARCKATEEKLGIKSISEYAKGYEKGYEAGIKITLKMIKTYEGINGVE